MGHPGGCRGRPGRELRGEGEEGLSSIFLVTGGAEIAARRARLAPGDVIEAWPDLQDRDHYWLDEDSKRRLDACGTPVPAKLAVDAEAVPIFYGARLADLESLPREGSLRARCLSGRGIAVMRITRADVPPRAPGETASADDPTFFLRRPGGGTAHVWTLFRTRADAIVWALEHGADPEAEAWARGLPAETFTELVARHATPG